MMFFLHHWILSIIGWFTVGFFGIGLLWKYIPLNGSRLTGGLLAYLSAIWPLVFLAVGLVFGLTPIFALLEKYLSWVNDDKPKRVSKDISA